MESVVEVQLVRCPITSYTGHTARRNFIAAYYGGGKAGKFVLCPGEFENPLK
jgi:hypothetical protein